MVAFAALVLLLLSDEMRSVIVEPSDTDEPEPVMVVKVDMLRRSVSACQCLAMNGLS